MFVHVHVSQVVRTSAKAGAKAGKAAGFDTAVARQQLHMHMCVVCEKYAGFVCVNLYDDVGNFFGISYMCESLESLTSVFFF